MGRSQPVSSGDHRDPSRLSQRCINGAPDGPGQEGDGQARRSVARASAPWGRARWETASRGEACQSPQKMVRDGRWTCPQGGKAHQGPSNRYPIHVDVVRCSGALNPRGFTTRLASPPFACILVDMRKFLGGADCQHWASSGASSPAIGPIEIGAANSLPQPMAMETIQGGPLGGRRTLGHAQHGR